MVLAFFYGVSIIGVIYTMVHYVLIFERYYLPPSALAESGDDRKLTGSYVLFTDGDGASKIVDILRSSGGPSLVFTRSPDSYRGVGDNVVSVWITQATDKGVSPTKLHILQERAIDFMRRNPGGVVVLDDIDYLLMYNEFPVLFRFLVAVKDHAAISGSAFVVVVDRKSIGDKEHALLLSEFKPL